MMHRGGTLRLLSFCIYLFSSFLFSTALVKAQETAPNKYGLTVISNPAVYKKQVAADPSQALVDLATYIPGIQLDIRYATANNFLGEPVYTLAKAYLRQPVAQALKNVQSALHQQGLGLKIYDAYRPYRATVYFFDKLRDTVYLAVPWQGSRHNRGCTVDLTLVDLKTGKELRMPTPYDDFTKKAHVNYTDLPAAIIKNRELLKEVMTRQGFQVYAEEWWHFDYYHFKKFDLLDIAFEDLP
ncbi:M15 family metallopeptidase [Adhaeribacter pallidiroseus]|uniref:D-alanyl-D-alanine dipeptidase n=1 Tax=Adhaeribacter pallidiroseus TaxID=2072847 RepID=A0A369QGZ7_9BACT|nr:M15 family metallopeptidase [Adhaeribacter pallidiroseus]RDC63702.1 D-Ala-D-Ala dipeptidase [Adhaeribacter pallidiroseus]